MERYKLLKLLDLFKQSREKLYLDFIKENIEIFEPIFKYENDKELMSLAIEKYFTSYINSHFESLKDYDNLDQEFNKSMLTFVQKFNINVSDQNFDNSRVLFYSIIKKKEIFLKEIISVGNIDSERFRKLSYSYHKDKTLFDREIKALGEK